MNMMTSPGVFVNVAGAEFSFTFWPRKMYLTHLANRGVKAIRLCLKWEKMQPVLDGPLDAGYLSASFNTAGDPKGLMATLELCNQLGIKVQPEIHNYCEFTSGGVKRKMGSAGGPTGANLADLHVKLYNLYGTHPAVIGIGLMNEPNGLQPGVWKAAAQLTVDALRNAGCKHWLFVCGDGWSGAHSWRRINNDFHLVDPLKRICYEAHQYFDLDSSGDYGKAIGVELATMATPAKRLEPFISWLKEHGYAGCIGEMGVPYDAEPEWLDLQREGHRICAENKLAVWVWTAGQHMGAGNPLTQQIEVKDPDGVVRSVKDTSVFEQVTMPRLTPWTEPLAHEKAVVTPPPPVTEPTGPTPTPTPTPVAIRNTGKPDISIGADGRLKIIQGSWEGAPKAYYFSAIRDGTTEQVAADPQPYAYGPRYLPKPTVPQTIRVRGVVEAAASGDAGAPRVRALTWNSVEVPATAVTPPPEPVPDPVVDPDVARIAELEARLKAAEALLATERAADAAEDAAYEARLAAQQAKFDKIRIALEAA